EYGTHFRERSFPRREDAALTFRPSRTLELVVTNSLLEIEPQNTLLLSIFHDVTEKKRAEAALQDSELRFQTIFQDAALGIALADLRGRILRTNPALEQLLGFEKSQLVGLMATEVLDPSVRARFRADLEELAAGRSEAMQRELRCQRRDGTKLWGSLTLSLCRDSAGRPVHVIAMIEDVTDRKRLERDLADLTFQEQQRIGQEVHDGIGQELTGLGYLAGTLHRKLSERGGPESQIAGQLSEGLSRALAQARAVARGLMPVDVEAGGLEHALEELARRVCGWFDIECRFVSRGSIAIQNRSAVNHLYRIAQEAVTNAVKHGQAKQVTIELSGDEEQTRLRIADDGRGFAGGSDEPSGVGLRIMHYRADMIGADLHVAPRPEGGVIITCTFADGSLPAD
ncbi:MAG: PAS domain-containing sensor histidine kinase, partial [Planctomycetaceae bacterium]